MQPKEVLYVRRLPARLSVQDVAAFLGFHQDSINYLVDNGLLPTLGGSEGVQRVFAATEIDSICRDTKWLTKATNRVREHHKARNAAQKARRNSKDGPTIT